MGTRRRGHRYMEFIILKHLSGIKIRSNKLIVSYPGYAFIKMMNDSTKGLAFNTDTFAKKIVMFSYADTSKKSNFVYSFPQKNVLLFAGKLNNDSVVIEM